MESKIWREDRNIAVEIETIKTDRRIGVEYAGIYVEKPWGFIWQAPIRLFGNGG